MEQKRFHGVSTAVYAKHLTQPWAGLGPQANVSRRSRERKTWFLEPEHSFLASKCFTLVHGHSDTAKSLHIKLSVSEFWAAPGIHTSEMVRRHAANKQNCCCSPSIKCEMGFSKFK